MEKLIRDEGTNKVFNVVKSHEYMIKNKNDEILLEVHYQTGPISATMNNNVANGVLDIDLLAIIRDRILGFQQENLANEYNEKILEGVEMAMKAIQDRYADRDARGVQGTMKK